MTAKLTFDGFLFLLPRWGWFYDPNKTKNNDTIHWQFQNDRHDTIRYLSKPVIPL
jgi:hypothetical protein